MDPDILSMLFRATEQTQKPFIKRVISSWKKYENNPDSLASWIKSIILNILKSEPNNILLDFLREVLYKLIPPATSEYSLLKEVNSIYINDRSGRKYVYASSSSSGFINANGLTSTQQQELKIDSIFEHLRVNVHELDFFD